MCGWVLTIIGLILVLIAMKGLSEVYGEGGIFSNALYGFISGVVGTIVLIAMMIIAFFSFMRAGMPMEAWVLPGISMAQMFAGVMMIIWEIFAIFCNFRGYILQEIV
ncbi:MAG: DUF996 domain-containing protein [Candidatus Bathyarchaeia archaeon]